MQAVAAKMAANRNREGFTANEPVRILAAQSARSDRYLQLGFDPTTSIAAVAKARAAPSARNRAVLPMSGKDWGRRQTGRLHWHSARPGGGQRLAHIVGYETETAYRRGDLFDKRKPLMDAWPKRSRARASILPKHCLPDSIYSRMKAATRPSYTREFAVCRLRTCTSTA